MPVLSIVSVADGRLACAHAGCGALARVVASRRRDRVCGTGKGFEGAEGGGRPIREQQRTPRYTGLPDVPDRFGNGLMSWSSDGRKLAVAGLPGARAGYIWIFEPGRTTPPRKLLDLRPGVYLRGMSWSSDGSSIIVGHVQRSSDIVLAERSAVQAGQ